jgi:hypothetical protein
MNRSLRAIPFALAFLSLAASASVTTLCETSENIVWSCQAGKKIYSLCASKDLSSTTGYLQYRAGTSKSIELRYPAALKHPRGLIEFSLLAHGASVTFSNKGYSYFISEDLKDGTEISVEKSQKTIATISCDDSTDSLTENSTIDLLKAAGIAN